MGTVFTVTRSDTVTRGSLYLNYHLFFILSLNTLFINIFIKRKKTKKGGGLGFRERQVGGWVFG